MNNQNEASTTQTDQSLPAEMIHPDNTAIDTFRTEFIKHYKVIRFIYWKDTDWHNRSPHVKE